jgi:propane 2-monooxygenase small subunit
VRFFYGARTEADLFHLGEIEQLGAQVSDFRFTPVVERFVHEAVGEYLTTQDITAPDVYMCGPPPMIEAAKEMLTGEHGVDEARIFSDKFTTSADAAPAAQDAPPVKRVDSAPAPADNDLERDFAWFTSSKRRASLYEDVTIDTQPSIHRHLTRGWPVSFADGRGTWEESSTQLRSGDWYAFRDPGEQWERPYYQRASAVENQIESAMRSAAREGLIADFTPDWVEFLRTNLQVAAYIEHGLWFALATIGRDCLSDSVATCVCLHAAMKQRSAQALVLYAMDLEQHHGPFPITQARETFLHDESWQPTRRYVERLAATHDWGEVIVAANMCFEPIVGTMLRRELGIRAAAGRGDTVTPVIAQVANHEWEWAREWTTELIRMLLSDPEHGEHNRATIDGWLADWQPGAQAAADALGSLATVDAVNLASYSDALLVEAGLDGAGSRMTRAQPIEARLDAEPAASSSEPAERPPRRVRPTRTRPAPAAGDAAPGADVAPANGDGGYDYVGIVMAKSAEGDAVAEILRRREGIEVIEQPSFWDIRAKVRLATWRSPTSSDTRSTRTRSSTRCPRTTAGWWLPTRR